MSEAIKHLSDYDTDQRFPATVVANERLTPETSPEDVRELVLEIDRADSPYRLGQLIGVLAPGRGEFGTEHHFRLYNVADLELDPASSKSRIAICVRRCSYVDAYSGERYPGIASNFLCDQQPGALFPITGPYGIPFADPPERDAHLILIGSGTGIAPFRAFVKHLYREVEGWRGRVWLFYGARSGLELLYMNDRRNDFAQYYDEETFEAFQALSPRPSWRDPIAWDRALEQRAAELWRRLGDPKTYVYVAGLEPMLVELDRVFATLAGGDEAWQRRKAELRAGERWVELVY